MRRRTINRGRPSTENWRLPLLVAAALLFSAAGCDTFFGYETCTDNEKNGVESDVDCGGVTCGTCAVGLKCVAGTDCTSNSCVNGVCSAASCVNGVLDGTETAIDCGGLDCSKCAVGGGCLTAADCASATCINGTCANPLCSFDEDCARGKCVQGSCEVTSCTDLVVNGDETGVDCGGAVCLPCAAGLACLLGTDCASGSCVNTVCTDVQCVSSVECGENQDCVKGICSDPSCTDQAKSGAETDIDCGGGTCSPCADDKGCAIATDCVSNSCVNNICSAPSCTNGVLDGQESDLDCGGTLCDRCTAGACRAGTDCASGVCINQICTAVVELDVGILVNNDPQITHGYATLGVGQLIEFDAVAECPTGTSCTYAWDFGDGQTATTANPAPVSYSADGQYEVTLTVMIDGQSVAAGVATGYVTVWNGTMTDDFNRTDLELKEHLWLPAISSDAIWSLMGNRLHVIHDLRLPASGALVASPMVKNLHVEVTQLRAQVVNPLGTDEQNTHYSDVIVRMNPGNKEGDFYRVRVMEGWSGAGANNTLQIAIFKITDAADQHGVLINDRVLRPTSPPYPTVPQDVPVIDDFDPTRVLDFRIIVDVTTDAQTGGPRFKVKLVDAKKVSTILLEENWTDGKGVPDEVGPKGGAYNSEGLVGVTQFDGFTYFDDFSLTRLLP